MKNNAEYLHERDLLSENIIKNLRGTKQYKLDIDKPYFLAVSNRFSASKKQSYVEKVTSKIDKIKQELEDVIDKYKIICDYEIMIVRSKRPSFFENRQNIESEIIHRFPRKNDEKNVTK